MAKEYIEREAAFNAVLKLVPKVDDDGYCWVIRGDAARAIDSIPAADVRPVVPKWIPVTKRLPEYGNHVLVYAGFFQPYIEAAYYCEDRKWRFTYDDAEVIGVSHWMPLPTPPTAEEDE